MARLTLTGVEPGVEALRFTWKRLHEDPAARPDRIPAGRWLAAPLATMAMRRRMAHNGLVVVAIGHHKHRVKVDAFGLPLVEDYADFVEEAENDVMAALAKLKGGDRQVESAVAEAARLAARRAAQRWSGKKPQVKVMLLAEATTA